MRQLRQSDLDVVCPMCHADPGALCINIGHGSRFAGMVHSERRTAPVDAELDALRAYLAGGPDGV